MPLKAISFITMLFLFGILGSTNLILNQKLENSGKNYSLEKEYATMVEEVLVTRMEFKTAYNSSEQKDKVIKEAQDYLLQVLPDSIFPYWYGTPWDFNGTSRIPKKGKIACGYFVINTLTDIGMNIPRVKWAQSASEVFIKKLAPINLKRFSGKPLSAVEDHLEQLGDGIYLVGLDQHVGFITVKGENRKFVHASYYHPEIGVMAEEIDTDNPLKNSNYRVIGKLFSDAMVINWITNERY